MWMQMGWVTHFDLRLLRPWELVQYIMWSQFFSLTMWVERKPSGHLIKLRLLKRDTLNLEHLLKEILPTLPQHPVSFWTCSLTVGSFSNSLVFKTTQCWITASITQQTFLWNTNHLWIFHVTVWIFHRMNIILLLASLLKYQHSLDEFYQLYTTDLNASFPLPVQLKSQRFPFMFSLISASKPGVKWSYACNGFSHQQKKFNNPHFHLHF